MKKLPSDPRGQVLIITALALLVLIGIGALVADLGMSWMLRRHEQNAADPAAIAAARHLKDEFGDPSWDQGAAEADACFYARENGFFLDDTLDCDAALVPGGDLQVHSPPISGDLLVALGIRAGRSSPIDIRRSSDGSSARRRHRDLERRRRQHQRGLQLGLARRAPAGMRRRDPLRMSTAAARSASFPSTRATSAGSST